MLKEPKSSTWYFTCSQSQAREIMIANLCAVSYRELCCTFVRSPTVSSCSFETGGEVPGAEATFHCEESSTQTRQRASLQLHEAENSKNPRRLLQTSFSKILRTRQQNFSLATTLRNGEGVLACVVLCAGLVFWFVQDKLQVRWFLKRQFQ